MKLSNLSNLPNNSVFALHNPKKNKVHLMYAKNTLVRLARFIDELRNRENSLTELCDDLDDLELVILETYSTESVCKLMMNYWYDYVTEEEGMELYTKRNYLSYKARIEYLSFSYDYLNKNNVDLVYVQLVNSRGKGMIVGVFKSIPEAEEFKKNYLDIQRHITPVYATNDLTKNYISKLNHDRVRL